MCLDRLKRILARRVERLERNLACNLASNPDLYIEQKGRAIQDYTIQKEKRN